MPLQSLGRGYVQTCAALSLITGPALCGSEAALAETIGGGFRVSARRLTRPACRVYNLPQAALANTQRLIEAPRRRIRWPWQRET